MKLLEYLKKSNLTQKEFSIRVGVTDAHINHILQGKKNPSIHLVQRIVKETDGQVTIEDLFNPKLPSKLKNKKVKDE